MKVICAWCWQPFVRNTPQQLYCDIRCRQARNDYQRYGCGTPGRKPRRKQ